jgi:hypothetical protein
MTTFLGIELELSPLNVCLAWAGIYLVWSIWNLFMGCCRAVAAPEGGTPSADAAAVAAADAGDGGGATGEKLVFDDYFYKFCACCVPLCCAGQSRNQVFRERGMKELRSAKLELHLNNKMVVNVAPDNKPSYWSDMFYYVFQKDHFLSCLYCDHEHPFTKKERWMVYWTICCSVVMISTACRPPSDCEAWLNPKDPAYPKMHTWGRYDAGWTRFCESGMTPPNANLLAIIVAAIIKVTYGMILEYVAFCPCFVDYVGTFKDRTETAGKAVLWVCFWLGFVEIYIGAKVIQNSPYKMEMVIACINSIIVGIVTGWLTYWAMYHFNRVRQTGCKETNHRCCQGVDQDGDGVECTEVCTSMRGAWRSQQDTRAYDNPDDNDVVDSSKASSVASTSTAVAKVDDGSML